MKESILFSRFAYFIFLNAFSIWREFPVTGIRTYTSDSASINQISDKSQLTPSSSASALAPS